MAASCTIPRLCFVVYGILLHFYAHGVGAAKILVVPMDGSHWVNIKTLMTELLGRGHTFTVLRPSNSIFIEEKSEDFFIETIQVESDSKEDIYNTVNGFVYRTFTKQLSPLSITWEFFKIHLQTSRKIAQVLEAVFENKTLMERFEAGHFELALADPSHAGGVMLAHYLKIPVVIFGRLTLMEDMHFAITPSPLSYVPVVNSRVTDRMGFMERLQNVFQYSINQFLLQFFIYPMFDKLCQRYLKTDKGLYGLYKKADIYLMKEDFVLEFPRPTMPNVVYIGGFHCEPPKVLPEEIQEFMDSSGDDGVVVVSLGIMAQTLPLEMANKMASGLALLYERVIWHYIGETPWMLGTNTKVLNLFPQNDILSHPKTKAFISHGDENSIYEAIYHGVPVLGLPLLGDHYENILRLKSRGAAVLLENFSNCTAEDIYKAVGTVIDNPSFRANMQRLSALHRDTLVHPMEAAIFWTEFTIRHKGASHLQVAGHELAFYQYYLLDVFGLLAAILVFFFFIAWKLLKEVVKKDFVGATKIKSD